MNCFISFFLFIGLLLHGNNIQRSIQSDSEKERLLSRKWQLTRDMICDRCHDYIPKDTILTVFNGDHTCYGAILGRGMIKNATWELIDNKFLLITYKDSNGKKMEKEYEIGVLSNTTLVLWQDTFGGTSRTFKAFN
jgi:hypothetical protein